MDCNEDSAFCVPVYGNAESASGQAQDHSSSKQDHGLCDEVVPVFNPSWRDKPHFALAQRDHSATLGTVPLESSLPTQHVDRRPAQGHTVADVSRCRLDQHIFWNTRTGIMHVRDAHQKNSYYTRRNGRLTETPWSDANKPTKRQRYALETKA